MFNLRAYVTMFTVLQKSCVWINIVLILHKNLTIIGSDVSLIMHGCLCTYLRFLFYCIQTVSFSWARIAQCVYMS